MQATTATTEYFNPNHVVTTDEDTIWDALVGEDCDFSSGDSAQIHSDLIEGAAAAGITVSEESSCVLMHLIEDRIAADSAEVVSLHDHATGEEIRDATPAELAESAAAAELDGGIGVILVDGRSCYAQ